MNWKQYQVSVPQGRSGKWRVERFDLTEEGILCHPEQLALGRPAEPGTYTKLVHEKRGIIMSDTPAEILEHAAVIRQIEEVGGRVLINGLGLGMVLQAALRSPKVTKVDVVEIDRNVIKLVGPHYQDSRLSIIQDSAYAKVWPENEFWDIVWHDIWDNINPGNLKKMRKLTKKYKGRCVWQGCWSEELCLEQEERFQDFISKSKRNEPAFIWINGCLEMNRAAGEMIRNLKEEAHATQDSQTQPVTS